ncbi:MULTISPECIES: DEAD/DEAH box helicase [Bosea]|uniref:DEAD/DEAH box helicase n=1 Tax=Bosea TaxID=85413 RepID=UPI002150217D|nr:MULTISPECIES: DEAD/DEAH box helicase [Bosea]MCR4523743.1 DEAD/DEAH box helicase [Bosea sp. 47.2.35]MDR6830048.1 superfamily II DNA/RNA helicase [Bosea robiniae]MDR6896991.1 superfamily II DNA/RNA helicase [Bosea sp. BE109]MDR7140328.1 superfamily II DNA/RNA helicase [Bosea sp. BE168]MDR7177085.1 superfamily II DNA/RNA helicase [Bosea sp. BE271]
MSFAELGLSEKVLTAVTAAGYNTPTPIQAQAIPHVLARKDVLGIAQTGTGKTAAFTLPMLTILETGRARARMPRTLILEPTRELAAQVEENFVRYGVNQKLSVALLIGGVSFGDQDAKITRGVDVLIATPGRLLDHVERGKLLLTGVELLVIDEADRMLDMGFIPDIERVCKLVPFTRQTLFFTATMPPEITRISEQFLHNPVRVEVSRPATAAATITQRLIASNSQDFEKRETLRKLIKGATDLQNAIVFCNRKRDVATLHKSLQRHGFPAVALHGDMDQYARMAALESFRTGENPILVASDVAARGLDIPAVSHVFNFDVPTHAEDYVHRIGRTGRAGRLGTAFTIVTRHDDKLVSAVEKLTGQTIAFEGPGLDALPPGEPRDERRGGRRDDKRSSSRGRGRPERERGPRAESEASPRSSEPEGKADAHRAPGRHEPVRPDSDTAAAKPRNQDGRRGRNHRDDDDGPQVKGLGDHVPAFLLRPARVG